ncbi:hypothetical protein [Candidatus Bathycorpusculum sp.]|jgi:hypothetical protein|uniref:hypothetical protein n=1 Tax=Candidatus Bathycorpusculum sp. TaxID=2994959 RepID=UPI002829A5A8|nr:hypothetical protein [Candidatus Termitimicrobium sp.]
MERIAQYHLKPAEFDGLEKNPADIPLLTICLLENPLQFRVKPYLNKPALSVLDVYATSAS